MFLTSLDQEEITFPSFNARSHKYTFLVNLSLSILNTLLYSLTIIKRVLYSGNNQSTSLSTPMLQPFLGKPRKARIARVCSCTE